MSSSWEGFRFGAILLGIIFWDSLPVAPAKHRLVEDLFTDKSLCYSPGRNDTSLEKWIARGTHAVQVERKIEGIWWMVQLLGDRRFVVAKTHCRFVEYHRINVGLPRPFPILFVEDLPGGLLYV